MRGEELNIRDIAYKSRVISFSFLYFSRVRGYQEVRGEGGVGIKRDGRARMPEA